MLLMIPAARLTRQCDSADRGARGARGRRQLRPRDPVHAHPHPRTYPRRLSACLPARPPAGRAEVEHLPSMCCSSSPRIDNSLSLIPSSQPPAPPSPGRRPVLYEPVHGDRRPALDPNHSHFILVVSEAIPPLPPASPSPLPPPLPVTPLPVCVCGGRLCPHLLTCSHFPDLCCLIGPCRSLP